MFHVLSIPDSSLGDGFVSKEVVVFERAENKKKTFKYPTTP